MERPTWKNTLYSGHVLHSLHEFAHTARELGYPYFEWNGRISSSNSNNGMHKIGRSPDLPVCMASELDQPGGVQWCDGLRPILQDIESMARDTLRGPLLDTVSGHISDALATIMLPNLDGSPSTKIEDISSALDDYCLRDIDSDESMAVAVAALRVRVVVAMELCEDLMV